MSSNYPKFIPHFICVYCGVPIKQGTEIRLYPAEIISGKIFHSKECLTLYMLQDA